MRLIFANIPPTDFLPQASAGAANGPADAPIALLSVLERRSSHALKVETRVRIPLGLLDAVERPGQRPYLSNDAESVWSPPTISPTYLAVRGHKRFKEGSWRLIVANGFGPLTGRRRSVYETVRAPNNRAGAKKADARLAELITTVESGRYPEQQEEARHGPSVADIADAWHRARTAGAGTGSAGRGRPPLTRGGTSKLRFVSGPGWPLATPSTNGSATSRSTLRTTL